MAEEGNSKAPVTKNDQLDQEVIRQKMGDIKTSLSERDKGYKALEEAQQFLEDELEDANTEIGHGQGKYLIKKPLELALPDTILVVHNGSWLHSGTNQHKMKGMLVASEPLTKKIAGKVEAYLAEKAKGFPPETLRSLVMSPLMKDGRLVIEVPNIDSWYARWFGGNWFHLDAPRHLYHFSPKTLRDLLSRQQFEVVYESTFNRLLDQLLNVAKLLVFVCTDE